MLKIRGREGRGGLGEVNSAEMLGGEGRWVWAKERICMCTCIPYLSSSNTEISERCRGLSSGSCPQDCPYGSIIVRSL